MQFHPESAGGPLDTIEVSRHSIMFGRNARLILAQMFTDFLAECRAHKLQLGLHAEQPMDAAKVAPALRQETPPEVAVVA